MIMKIYSTKDGENVINKRLNFLDEFTIRLKNETDMYSPTIILNDRNINNLLLSNYCYLDEFNRYYFIRSIENQSLNLWVLNLECDVLESFKDEILNSHGEVDRAMEESFYDGGLLNESRKEIDIVESDVEVKFSNNIMLVMFGVNSDV